MSEWQPMSTATKDSRPRLLWDDYWLMRIGKWMPRLLAEVTGREEMLRPGEDGCWVQDLPYGDERGEREMRLDPVLWAPLPRPPAHALAPDAAAVGTAAYGP